MIFMAEAENQPLYIQLRDMIKGQIESGILKPGDKVPSETALQKSFNVSRVTVRKGTYVSQVQEFAQKKRMSSFTQLCRLQGKATIAKVLRAEMIVATEEQCKFFNIKEGSWITCVERVRKVDGVPMVLETNYFHPFCEFLTGEDLTGSIYDLLTKKYHIYPVKRGLNEVGIINAGEKEARLLEMKEGISVLTSYVQVYDSKDNPVHEVSQVVRVDRPDIFKYYIN